MSQPEGNLHCHHQTPDGNTHTLRTITEQENPLMSGKCLRISADTLLT